jgi:phosphoserine phosphatase RsbU/P
MFQEIETASQIQKKIIPQTLPEINGFDIAGINIPSLEVGGDYFDVIKLKNGKFLLIIADVSGKGVASGLLVNTLNATLNAYVENDFSLTDISFRLNKVIYKSSTPDKYITCFLALLDPETSSFEYVNAGHNPIFHFSNNQLYKLEKGGIAFGMFDFGIPYESGNIILSPNDRILFYTDGVTEAMNELEEEYSDEKLEQFFSQNNLTSANEFIDAIVADVKRHAGTAHQSDDITALLLIKKNEL